MASQLKKTVTSKAHKILHGPLIKMVNKKQDYLFLTKTDP